MPRFAKADLQAGTERAATRQAVPQGAEVGLGEKMKGEKKDDDKEGWRLRRELLTADAIRKHKFKDSSSTIGRQTDTWPKKRYNFD